MDKKETTQYSFNPHIFRDYDIRGIVGEDFDESFSVQLAIAIDKFFPEGSIVLSRDVRRSGIPLVNAMQLALFKRGRRVINIGENPTPLLYYAICKERAIAGVQITASHKAAHWNGFKVNASDAMPVDGVTGIYQIRDLIQKDITHKDLSSTMGGYIQFKT